MGMKLTIHQPEFLPWLGFLDKTSLSDKFIVLDNVQYRHKYFQNRNKIKTITGETWLNVPVQRNGKTRDIGLIQDIKIDNTKDWSNKITRCIYHNYCKTPYYSKYSPELFKIFNEITHVSLCDLNIKLIKFLFKVFKIKTEIIRASSLNISGSGEDLILKIARHFKPEIYISGPTGIAGRGTDYEKHFTASGIGVVYHKFSHPIYKQASTGFIPNMSSIDKLFNVGV